MNEETFYFQQPGDGLRLRGVRRAVAVSVARHQIGTRLHQLAVEGNPRLVLDAFGGRSVARIGRSGRPAGVVAAQAAAADANASVGSSITGGSGDRCAASGRSGRRVLRDETFFAWNEDVVAEALDDEADELLAQRELARQEPQRHDVVRQRNHVMVKLITNKSTNKRSVIEISHQRMNY